MLLVPPSINASIILVVCLPLLEWIIMCVAVTQMNFRLLLCEQLHAVNKWVGFFLLMASLCEQLHVVYEW